MRRTPLAAGTLLAAWLAVACAPVLTQADQLVEGRETGQLLAKMEVTFTERTAPDRSVRRERVRIISIEGRAFPERSTHTIVRLDRALVWTLNDADSTYTEESFAFLARFARAIGDTVTRPTRVEIEPPIRIPEHVAGIDAEHCSVLVKTWPGGLAGQRFNVQAWFGRGVAGFAEFAAYEKQLAALALPGAGIVGPTLQGPEAAVAFAAMESGRFVLRQETQVGARKDADGWSEPDPAVAALVYGSREVTSIRSVPFDPEAYELPKGYRRVVSKNELLIEQLEQANREAEGKE